MVPTVGNDCIDLVHPHLRMHTKCTLTFMWRKIRIPAQDETHTWDDVTQTTILADSLQCKKEHHVLQDCDWRASRHLHDFGKQIKSASFRRRSRGVHCVPTLPPSRLGTGTQYTFATACPDSVLLVLALNSQLDVAPFSFTYVLHEYRSKLRAMSAKTQSSSLPVKES